MQHYELLKQIGKGSYGKVFTARNYQDHELYVLKRVPFDGASQADAEAALREANVLSLLRHPHIVPYKEFFNHDGDLCLVMAHCEGGDIYHHVKQLRKAGKSVDEEKAWQWMVQLLLALSYCHSKKILHRDVKTQNVFMTKDGKLMLGDFGLAKQLQRTLEMARTPIGTPYYMAPEIYEEEPYSYKSDVWALGCVFYEILTGKPAFAADNLSRVVIRVLRGTYDPLPDEYSSDLRDIIGCMLTKEVKKRPNVNELLQHPCVVSKVQAYLDQLSKSAAGGAGGWSTWRMKLPPGILVQMANIIRRASESGTVESNDVHKGNKQARQAVTSNGMRPAGGILGCFEDLLTPEELIEEFGLQSLVDEATKPGQAAQGHNGRQLLAATLHPDDGKQLKLPSAAQGALSELQVLKTQMTAVQCKASAATAQDHEEHYEDDFESHDEDEERPAAQLLGMTHGAKAGVKHTTMKPSDVQGDGAFDIAMLSAGLPKAGFGFGGAAPPPAPVLTPPQHPPPQPVQARRQDGGKLATVAGGASPAPPKQVHMQAPADGVLAPCTPNWKLGTAAPGKASLTKAGLNATGNLTLSAGQISLRGTFTNRAAFLRKELSQQLGSAGLQAVCALIRDVHAANGGEPVSDSQLREALSGAVSKAHLELVPLLDEFVLLQDRFYDV